MRKWFALVLVLVVDLVQGQTCTQSGKDSIPDISWSAEENVDNGNVLVTSSDLELVWDSLFGIYFEQIVGITFPSVDIASGSTVESASILFEIDEDRPNQSDDPIDLLIYGDKAADSQVHTGVNSDFANREPTNTKVAWAPEPTVARPLSSVGDDLETADIGPIIQEIIDLDDWVSGNQITIFFKGDPKNPPPRGSSRWVEPSSTNAAGITTPELRWTASSCSSCDKGNFLSKGTCSPCPSDTYQDADAHTDTFCKPQATCGPGERIGEDSKEFKRTCNACEDDLYQVSTDHRNPTCWTSSLTCGPGERISQHSSTSKRTCSACPENTYQDADAHTETECKPQPTCGAGEVLLFSDENEVGECTKLNCDPLSFADFKHLGDHVDFGDCEAKAYEVLGDSCTLGCSDGYTSQQQIAVQCFKKTAKKTAEYVMWEKNQVPQPVGLQPGLQPVREPLEEGRSKEALSLRFLTLEAEPPTATSLHCQADPCIATDDPDTVSQTEKYCGDGLVVSGTTGTCGCVGTEDVASFGYAAPSSGNSGYAAYAVTILVFSICMVLFGLLLMFK